MKNVVSSFLEDQAGGEDNVLYFPTRDESGNPKNVTSIQHRDNDNTFVCDACGKLYKNKTNLVRHQRCVHNSESQTTCPFELCQYKSARSDLLRNHIHSVHNVIEIEEPIPLPYKPRR